MNPRTHKNFEAVNEIVLHELPQAWPLLLNKDGVFLVAEDRYFIIYAYSYGKRNDIQKKRKPVVEIYEHKTGDGIRYQLKSDEQAIKLFYEVLEHYNDAVKAGTFDPKTDGVQGLYDTIPEKDIKRFNVFDIAR